MKSTVLIEALLVAVLLVGIGSSVVRAQHAGHGDPSFPFPSAPAVRTGKAKGKIVEFDRTSITLETEQKGRTETVTYLVGDRTKIKGDLTPGADVVVKFREEDGGRMATSIEVKKAKGRC